MKQNYKIRSFNYLHGSLFTDSFTLQFNQLRCDMTDIIFKAKEWQEDTLMKDKSLWAFCSLWNRPTETAKTKHYSKGFFRDIKTSCI